MTDFPSRDIVLDHVRIILFFGVLTFFIHWIAKAKGFFALCSVEQREKAIFFKNVVIAFAIYLVTILFIGPLFVRALFRLTDINLTTSPEAAIIAVCYVQFFSMAITLIGLFLYSKGQRSFDWKKMWKDRSYTNAKPILYDFFLGVGTWLISFPLVVVISQLCDMVIYLIFKVEAYEQVAVRFLKLALTSPSTVVIALLTIIVMAPFIEEWLFRGFLQSWLKKHLGSKAAIMLTALCFALFHYSSSQGVGNISLTISLFVLGCYLGFLYEKQRSLFASIGLHMTFNVISSMRILLYPT